ncbi:MAG: Asp-tRNA(Asn)/Glu-tRNA(Gln) amidotransferase GatCAB subunit C [Candidatus Portnoybacteria bacterium CG03_land_8_20_14_0_80_41_10]|uniref:Aspartyl/glutamyl-tRNA(Asn/Gln) amidotransferase subunit C n=1 Tax=Candidatus Portnoybacteria bacterium CG03_land_8_20_14_0_80_41_10 TaxID=1974808 RepID=A0A2M7BUU5_9BACT|nr:MAG: Asp-tRNA(Asn)/Glu-tRNA(Gln) amidotransferase GatCAB subunit C [Candidatus Portnoybacteria bacterium CG03_land_8_20_14_0_80_41_10]
MLSTADVLHIAKLVNITLTHEEIPLYQRWLAQALDYIKILEELDTSQVSPTYQVTNNQAVYRPDVEDTNQHLPQSEVLKNVPLTAENGYFEVNKVVWG